MLVPNIWAQQGTFFSEQPVFRMAIAEGPIEWNPLYSYTSAEAQLFTGIYEGLVAYHPMTQKPIPALAESWEISPDKLTYTFHIRSNAVFSNGDSIRAEHVRNTWLFLLSLGQNAPFGSLLDPVKGASDFRQKKNQDELSVGIRAPDDGSLVVELHSPAPWFLQILCHQSMVPIHPTMLNVQDWSKLAVIIGNGPYTLKINEPTNIVYTRNPLYWDNLNVKIQSVEILRSENFPELTARFNNHEFQWLASGADYENVSNKSAIILTPQFSTTFLFFNQRQKPLQDPKVRQGLTMLLDLPKLRDKENHFIPSAKLVPSIPYYPDVKTLEKQDTKEGLKLLAEAGFPNGKGLPQLVLKLPAGEDSKRISNIFEAAWSSLDCGFLLQQEKNSNYNDSLTAKDYTVGILSWIGDFGDPLTFLDLFTTNGNLNYAANKDAAFMEKLKEGNAKSGTDRYQKLAEAEELLLLNATCIPTNHSPSLNVIDLDQVEGWFENPFDVHPFKYLSPKTPKPPRNIAFDGHHSFAYNR